MTLLIVFALIAIGVSFVCSILEAALLSITPSYVAGLKDKQPQLYSRLHALKSQIDDPLAAILTLNTVAHTVGATGVGAQVTVVFGEGWLGLASAVMTLAILILSEIIPKTIGAKFWRGLAPMLPPVLRAIMVALKPLVWLSRQITRRFGAGTADVDVRAEIRALARMGRDQKALDDDEFRVIHNILGLHQILVRAVMTPRTVCRVVGPDMTVGTFKAQEQGQPFSRYPILNANEEALGLVHKSDLLDRPDDLPLKDVARELTMVRDTLNIEDLFNQMLSQRQHMAAVYDEMGAWVGLVTLEDVLESILGQEIMDEFDHVPDLRHFARQRWSRRLKQQTR